MGAIIVRDIKLKWAPQYGGYHSETGAAMEVINGKVTEGCKARCQAAQVRAEPVEVR